MRARWPSFVVFTLGVACSDPNDEPGPVYRGVIDKPVSDWPSRTMGDAAAPTVSLPDSDNSAEQPEAPAPSEGTGAWADGGGFGDFTTIPDANVSTPSNDAALDVSCADAGDGDAGSPCEGDAQAP